MKKYGIYLAYPPTINLFGEGLGQHLMEFLKGAQKHGDVCFVIACPSWMRADLSNFFAISNIHSTCYEFIGPEKKPLILSLYEKYKAARNGIKKNRLKAYARFLKKKMKVLRFSLGRMLIGMRYTPLAIVTTLILLPVIIMLAIPLLLGNLICRWGGKHAKSYIKKRASSKKQLRERLSTITHQPKTDSSVVTMYKILLETETRLMLQAINQRLDVRAWYCPTAFWPSFNKINAPRLTCIPDVVLSSFPIGFSMIDKQGRYLDALKQVEKTIKGSTHFVTYSDDVKWNTLVHRYHKDPERVTVIRHGANQLHELIQVSGFRDNELSTNVLSRQLFYNALKKMIPLDDSVFKKSQRVFFKNEIQFLFYASQCRPNKNIISLLRAYNYLLKKRFLSHKLILTGDPNVMPEIADFIVIHNLSMDVLFLHRLTPQELASCYRLADLAVNPSLSEGGCPFTFTEALSVNTPVVMAKIPVTEEVITSPELQEIMFFDPYDWQDMAYRIEWALEHKEELLQKQKPFYDVLTQRTWTHVVDDYMQVLEQISAPNGMENKEQLLIESV